MCLQEYNLHFGMTLYTALHMNACMHVQAYTLVSDAGKQARQLARYLHAVNNKPLQASTALVSADTGEVLQQVGGGYGVLDVGARAPVMLLCR